MDMPVIAHKTHTQQLPALERLQARGAEHKGCTLTGPEVLDLLLRIQTDGEQVQSLAHRIAVLTEQTRYLATQNKNLMVQNKKVQLAELKS